MKASFCVRERGTACVDRRSFWVPMCGLALLLGVVASAWLLLSPEANAGGDAVPTPLSVVEKAIEAHGGFKLLSRPLAIERIEEGEMVVDGEKIPIKCEWQFQPPDKRGFHAVIKIGSLQLSFRQGMVGDKGWMKFGPAQAADLSQAQVDGAIWEHSNHVRNVIRLTERNNYDLGAPKSMQDRRPRRTVDHLHEQDDQDHRGRVLRQGDRRSPRRRNGARGPDAGPRQRRRKGRAIQGALRRRSPTSTASRWRKT